MYNYRLQLVGHIACEFILKQVAVVLLQWRKGFGDGNCNLILDNSYYYTFTFPKVTQLVTADFWEV